MSPFRIDEVASCEAREWNRKLLALEVDPRCFLVFQRERVTDV